MIPFNKIEIFLYSIKYIANPAADYAETTLIESIAQNIRNMGRK